MPWSFVLLAGLFSGLICVVLLVALMLVLNAITRYRESRARIRARVETFCRRRWYCERCEYPRRGARPVDGICRRCQRAHQAYCQEIAG